MAESKSDDSASKISGHSEKFGQIRSLSINRLSLDSERLVAARTCVPAREEALYFLTVARNGGPRCGFWTAEAGGARGADTLSEQWAQDREVPTKTYAADWKRDGRAVGPSLNF
jgi:SLOG family YspA-like protein